MPVKIKDKDKGMKDLVQMMGEFGGVILGVQGKEATAIHPNAGVSVGELAAQHELGLGVKPRSWLRAWIDANQARMAKEAAEAFQRTMRGASRRKELEKLAFEWTKSMRERITNGEITPPLAESTARKKGHSIPLLDSGTLHNAITSRIYLPQKRSIRDPAQRAKIK